jgi:hypothetical protein
MDTCLFLVLAAFIGAFRGAGSLILEHPLDVIKTYWQAHPSRTSFLTIGKEIYNLKGWHGFYAGAIPNVMRIMLKQAYRYPLMIVLPPIFGWVLTSVVAISMITGLSIAIFEVWVITPLERFKVWLMTYQKSAGGIKSFIKAFKQDALHTLYKGLRVTMLRQVTSWIVFLVVHDQLMIWVKTENGGSVNISILMLFVISLIEGSINTLAVQPLDCVKTNQQKATASKQDNIISMVRWIYFHYGVRGVYVGWSVRMMQYMINSGFTLTVLERLKTVYESH